jgi:hypothetical protein
VPAVGGLEVAGSVVPAAGEVLPVAVEWAAGGALAVFVAVEWMEGGAVVVAVLVARAEVTASCTARATSAKRWMSSGVSEARM